MRPNPSIERTCPGKPGHVLSSQTLAIQPAPPGLRAEETWGSSGVPLRGTPHMTGKPLVPLWPVR
jgi:hypothetical protein